MGSGIRKNCLGYPVISDELYRKVFGDLPRNEPDKWEIRKAERLLKSFNIEVPVKVDEEVNKLNFDLDIPPLKGKNIIEHFENIAKDQVGDYVENLDIFARSLLQITPGDFDKSFESNIGYGGLVTLALETFNKSNSGNFWVRIAKISENELWIDKVEYPEEKCFVFDTETYVNGGNRPIIGTAVSEKALYLWLAKELVLEDHEGKDLELISIGYDSAIVGHNVSFDRGKCKEPYELSHKLGPDNFWVDTLSMHVAVSGLASGQRYLYVLNEKDPDSLSEEDKKKLKRKVKWLQEGSTNALTNVYNFHVAEPRSLLNPNQIFLGKKDKEARNIFVDAKSIQEIKNQIYTSVQYALLDSIYTFEVFQVLWKKYRECTPSLVGICGHYYLGASRVPLVPDWEDWLENTEKVWNEKNERVSEIVHNLAEKHYKAWIAMGRSEDYWKDDPWLRQMNWKYTIRRRNPNKGQPNPPAWYKNVQGKISSRNRNAHLLLRLKWLDSPVEFIKDRGWCFGEAKERIPHPSGKPANVGGLLSKDFIEHYEVGRLSSEDPEAEEVLKIAKANSFWTSIRKRVLERNVERVSNPYGEDANITIPSIIPHGTLTRRTVEPVLATMPSCKPDKVGSELKSRLQAPEGMKIIGADFDAQELRIGAIYCDADETGILGGSAMANQILNGSKKMGTDGHTAFARNMMSEEYEDLIFHPEYGILERI